MNLDYFKKTVPNLFLILWIYSQSVARLHERLKCITLFQKLFLLLSPFLHFLSIFPFSFANACFRQNIVFQLQDVGSSHLEAFSNLGVPPISDKSYNRTLSSVKVTQQVRWVELVTSLNIQRILNLKNSHPKCLLK